MKGRELKTNARGQAIAGLTILLAALAPLGCMRYGTPEELPDASIQRDGVDGADRGDAGIPDAGVDTPDADAVPASLRDVELDHWRRYGLLRIRAQRECMGAFERSLALPPEAVLCMWEMGPVGLWLTTDPGVGVDLAALESCEAAAVDGLCDGDDDRWCAAPEHVFRGRTQRGGACTLNMACQTGLCSMDPPSGINSSASCGRCLAPEDLKAAGEPCDALAICRSGFYCRGEPARCVSGLLGEPCRGDDDCREELFCSAGVCAVRGGEGAACSYFRDCDPAMVCLRGRCQARVGPGEPCPTGQECRAGLWCSDQKVCVSDLAAGEHCWATYACLPELYCDPATSTCVADLADNETCAWDPYGNRCREGSLCAIPEQVCAPKSPTPEKEGDPCFGVPCPYAERGLSCSGNGLQARCVQSRVVELGEACDLSFVDPLQRLCHPARAVCVRRPDGTDATCQALSEAGQSCGHGCRPPSFCDREHDICRDLPRSGEPCLQLDFFAICDFGFACENAVCRSWTELAPGCPEMPGSGSRR